MKSEEIEKNIKEDNIFENNIKSAIKIEAPQKTTSNNPKSEYKSCFTESDQKNQLRKVYI